MSEKKSVKQELGLLRTAMATFHAAIVHNSCAEPAAHAACAVRAIWDYNLRGSIEKFTKRSDPREYVDDISAFWHLSCEVYRRLFELANKHAEDLERANAECRRHIEKLEIRHRQLGDTDPPTVVDVTKVPIGTTFGKWRIEEINASDYDGGDILLEDTRDGFGGFYLPIELVQFLADMGAEFVPPEERTE